MLNFANPYIKTNSELTVLDFIEVKKKDFVEEYIKV